MAEENKQGKWTDRNNALKTFKHSDSYGWIHLVIGQNKETKRKFLRLKRYLNWFSIPDARYLSIVQQMLERGAKELDWINESTIPIVIHEEEKSDQALLSKDELTKTDLPDHIIEFIEANPDFTKRLISLNVQSQSKEYLFELLEIIDNAISKSGERFKVAFKEVVEKISKEDSKDLQELTDLMEKWNLFQITSITNTLKGRIDTIKTFEELIHDPNTFEINTENSIHRVLEKNMWLIDENYWIVQSNNSLRKFIGDEILRKDKRSSKKRPDFACVNPNDNNLVIVEIKRPSLELKKKELDQAELYHRIIKKYKGKDYRKIEIFLVGNKVSEEAKEIELLRKGVKIRTYTDFLDNCKKRYQEYLTILEKQNR